MGYNPFPKYHGHSSTDPGPTEKCQEESSRHGHGVVAVHPSSFSHGVLHPKKDLFLSVWNVQLLNYNYPLEN